MTNSLNYPVTFVVFGATGDLAEKKLFPALFSLYKKKLLPQHFRIVAFARRPFTDETFRELIEPGILSSLHPDTEMFRDFLGRITYHQGTFEEVKSYIGLINLLGEVDKQLGACSHKIFHLALSPFFYETVLKNLEASALNLSCTDGTGVTRVLIEKPIGTNLAEARKINYLLAEDFKEEQIFRVDHYLAKNALYDLLTMHLSNQSLAAVWNSEHIAKIKICLHEKGTAEGRGAFYDRVGALRDVGQNHMLEMLALLLMEKTPSEIDRDKRIYRANLLQSLGLAEIDKHSGVNRRAQYEGYIAEEGVAPASRTETFFRLLFTLKHGAWKDVPVTMESGKALSEGKVHVTVSFRESISLAFPDLGKKPVTDVTDIAFHIQPKPGIEFFFSTGKKKTFSYAPEDLPEDTTHGKKEGSPIAELEPDNYELVYLEALKNDQTRFVGKHEVDASWHFIDRAGVELEKTPLTMYNQGAKPDEI